MNLVFYPEVKLLTTDQSEETVRIHYLNEIWILPKIGPRPPFYTNPRYDAVYPLV